MLQLPTHRPPSPTEFSPPPHLPPVAFERCVHVTRCVRISLRDFFAVRRVVAHDPRVTCPPPAPRVRVSHSNHSEQCQSPHHKILQNLSNPRLVQTTHRTRIVHISRLGSFGAFIPQDARSLQPLTPLLPACNLQAVCIPKDPTKHIQA